ncbi:MAG: hypothetical protein WBM69_03335, partial [Desulfobacterales bacterium]
MRLAIEQKLKICIRICQFTNTKLQTLILNSICMSHLLEVKDLEVKFALRFGDLTAINGVNF